MSALNGNQSTYAGGYTFATDYNHGSPLETYVYQTSSGESGGYELATYNANGTFKELQIVNAENQVAAEFLYNESNGFSSAPLFNFTKLSGWEQSFIPDDAFAALSAAQLETFTPAGIRSLTSDEIQNISNSAINGLDQEFMETLSKNQVQDFTKSQVQSINIGGLLNGGSSDGSWYASYGVLYDLSKTQVQDLNYDQLQGLSRGFGAYDYWDHSAFNSELSKQQLSWTSSAYSGGRSMASIDSDPAQGDGA